MGLELKAQATRVKLLNWNKQDKTPHCFREIQLSASADFSFLFDLGLAVFAALGFSYLFSKIKQPVVVGQLIAGIIIGPFGLGLIQNLNTINLLASLGIILLLFTVGLELDPLEIS